MNKINLFLSLFLITIFSINYSYSQVNQKCTSDSLISELKFFYSLQGVDLEKDKSAYEKDSVISELAGLWNSSISREEKKAIIEIANYQTSRRFVKETTTWNYYRSIIYLKQNNQNNFAPWLSMLSHMSSSSLFTSFTTLVLIFLPSRRTVTLSATSKISGR